MEASNPVASAPTSAPSPPSTTADLAKDVPGPDQRRRSVMPGDFPVTPAQDIGEFIDDSGPASSQPKPLDGSRSTVPTLGHDGGHAHQSHRDEPRFGVNPLPATAGIDNPIRLKPGERVPDPSSFTNSTVRSNVTLDRESYERSESTPFLPPVVTPQEERMRKGTGVLDLSPITKNLIPESSLPIGPGPDIQTDPGPSISSVAPESSTVGLASKVPLEPRRHDPVRPSEPAGNANRRDPDPVVSSVGPDSSTVGLASSVPVEPRQGSVRTPRADGLGSDQDPAANLLASVTPESSTVKLASQVPLEPRQGSSGMPEGHHGAGVGKGLGPSISSVAPDASTLELASKAPLAPRPGSASLPRDHGLGTLEDRGPSISSVGPASSTVGLASQVPIEPRPDPAPGLSKGLDPDDETDDKRPGPTTSSAAPKSSIVGLASDASLEPREPASGVPRLVEESQQRAHVDPEASASSEAVAEKHAVEQELARRVHELPPTSEGVGGDSTRANPEAAVNTLQSTSGPAFPSVGASSAGFSVLPGSFPGSGDDRGVDTAVVSGSMAPRDVGGAKTTSESSTRRLPASISPTVPETSTATDQGAMAGVPDVVVRSLERAHQAPEAAANSEAVIEKQQVERELLEDVELDQSVGDPAPTQSAALSQFAPGPTPGRMQSSTRSIPSPVEPHQQSSGARSSHVDPGPLTRGLAASATFPATTPLAKSAARVSASTPNSESVIRESTPAPTVTTGVDRTTTEQVTTPQKAPTPAPVPIPTSTATPVQAHAASASGSVPTSSASTPTSQHGQAVMNSPGSETSKKDRRRSGFFGRLKDKLSKKHHGEAE